jgi:hypothetical protein
MEPFENEGQSQAIQTPVKTGYRNDRWEALG